MSMINDFDEWKKFLGQAVGVAKDMGFKQDQINDVATRLGNVLAERIDPANREQRVLKELWEAADEHQKRTIAEVVSKVVSKEAKS